MVDYTDDWMNPKPTGTSSFTYRAPQSGDPIEYLIERQKRTPVFGNPGSITSWEYWSKYDTAEKRDEVLVRLRIDHPIWQLRARDRDPYAERLRVRM